MRFLFSIILPMIMFSYAKAEHYPFSYLTTKEGLSHQQVEVLMQDKEGMLWIGTRNGLCRYDGYRIVTYYNRSDNLRSLKHNFIRSIFQDSRKNIWIGTYDGICRYCPETDDFQRYDTPWISASVFVENHKGQVFCSGSDLGVFDTNNDCFKVHQRSNREFILSMAVDADDNLYMSTNDGIFYYNPSLHQITQLKSPILSNFFTGSDGIVPLYFDIKGRLWVGRNGQGVLCYCPKSNHVDVWQPSQLSDGTVRAIAQDVDGNIWLGTEKGISILLPDRGIEILRQDFVTKNKINDNAIYAILPDKDGNIWIGTYFGGINVLLKNYKQFTWIEPGCNKKNLRGKAIRKMIEIDHHLWIATEDGGLNIYNTLNGNIHLFEGIPNLTHNIHELYYDTLSNDLWIGTFREGLFRYNTITHRTTQYLPRDNRGLPSDAIFTIVRQRMGKLWIGSTQGLRYFDPKTNTFLPINHPLLDNDFIYCLCLDTKDNVWIGTRNNGIFRYDAHNQTISQWSKKTLGSAIKDDYITTIYEDKRGRIWIGMNNCGLQYIDSKTLMVCSPDKELALSDNSICSIIEDQLQSLWITTARGLYQINKNRTSLNCFTIEDGLPINQFNFSSSLQTRDGRIYLGSVNGLVAFYPENISVKQGPFPVHLTQLNINNQAVTANTNNSPLTQMLDQTTRLKLTYDQARSFSIEYAAISLGYTSMINYQIRLLNAHSDWRNVGQDRKFVGSNLPAGRYHLQIRANNSNIEWEKAPVKEIELIIYPPFYASIWAYLIYLICLLTVIYYGVRFFSIRMKERNEVCLANMEKEQIKQINQMKIDFFTTVSHELKTPLSLIIAPLKTIAKDNTLTPVSNEHLNTVIKNTNKMVGLIDELVTFNRIESGQFQFFVQKGNPLEFIQTVCELFYPNALEKGITFYVDCKNNGEDVWFSPSYIEKIVNNLLSNAIKFTATGGEITLHASIIEYELSTRLYISVKDTGIGIAKEELNHIFDTYYQTKRGQNTNHSGWGIGLSLIKKLVATHKGKILVESTIGEGSCFEVILDVSADSFAENQKLDIDKVVLSISQYQFNPPSLITPMTSNIRQGLDEVQKRPNLLLVEDNEELLDFLTRLFAPKYRIFSAQNGKKALDIAQNNQIDIIISDIMMPYMTGIELCTAIKNDISTSHIPMILLTAKVENHDIIEGYVSGADAYIQKPFDPQILELQVHNILNMKQKQREEMNGSFDINNSSIILNPHDEAFIKKMNQFIMDNLDNEAFSVGDVTAQLGISRSVLHIKMRSLLNTSMGEYIRTKRLDEACKLLRQGYNVSETAYRTGFSDPNYFSKCFKKEYGVTPTDFIR